MEEMLNDKSKHQERIQQKENKIKKQVKLSKAYHILYKEPHRLLKRSVISCGNPKCVYCANPRRVFKEKTIQERKFEQTKQWKEDVWK